MNDAEKPTNVELDGREPHAESLVEFLRNSPLPRALAAGEISVRAFERCRDQPRDLDLTNLAEAE